MIKTSYFSKYKEPNGVCIARGRPKWFKGESIPELFPTWDMIKGNLSEEEYTRQYYERILSKCDPREIVKKAEGRVLLCWEKTGSFCHRRIVADWIERETGIVVPEII